jgi:hypothetical protein
VQQLRFYRRDEQIVSPFVTLLLVGAVSLVVLGVLAESTAWTTVGIGLFLAPVGKPELLELKTIARLDRLSEYWAPPVIRMAAGVRRALLRAYDVLRWSTYISACAWAMLVSLNAAGVADGAISSLMSVPVGVMTLQVTLVTIVIGGIAIPVAWLLEWADNNTEDGDLVSSPILASASVAAGLRALQPGIVGWFVLIAGSVLVVASDLATRVLH